MGKPRAGIRPEDILIETGLSVGGQYIRVVHVPTGIERGGRGSSSQKQVDIWIAEIEAELQERSRREKGE
jgi:hypothetical protein